MGPSQRRHSTGRETASNRARKSKRQIPDREREPPRPNLDAILGRFSDAISMVVTATHALIAAQDRADVDLPYDPGETIFTLKQGLNALRRVYNELDGAIIELS